MADDKKGPETTGVAAIKSLGITIGEEVFYPLSAGHSTLNPCAGRADGTSCGPGCICRAGQCYYTLTRLQQLGIGIVEDK